MFSFDNYIKLAFCFFFFFQPTFSLNKLPKADNSGHNKPDLHFTCACRSLKFSQALHFIEPEDFSLWISLVFLWFCRALNVNNLISTGDITVTQPKISSRCSTLCWFVFLHMSNIHFGYRKLFICLYIWKKMHNLHFAPVCIYTVKWIWLIIFRHVLEVPVRNIQYLWVSKLWKRCQIQYLFF